MPARDDQRHGQIELDRRRRLVRQRLDAQHRALALDVEHHAHAVAQQPQEAVDQRDRIGQRGRAAPEVLEQAVMEEYVAKRK